MQNSDKLKQVYYKNNRIQQIRGFCNVVIYGSLVAAAKAMGLGQSTISLQIQSLERDLKTQLFKRSKTNYRKRVELTSEGRRFYEIACPIINATDDLFHKFFLENEKYHSNVLKIAGHHSVFSILLPPFLKQLKTENSDLKFKLSYLTKKEAFDQIVKGEFDIAIYPIEDVNTVPAELKCRRIATYKPALIMPDGHPLSSVSNVDITFDKIGKYNYIHTGSYAISDIMTDNISSKTLKGDIDLNYGSWDMMEELVRAGLGITIFHEDYIRNPKGLCIKKVYHLSPNIAYYAIFKRDSENKKVVVDLLKLIMLQSVAGK